MMFFFLSFFGFVIQNDSLAMVFIALRYEYSEFERNRIQILYQLKFDMLQAGYSCIKYKTTEVETNLTDSDHKHDDPHDDSSSDNTPSDMQEKSQSEEDEVESDLKLETESSDKEESSDGHSRRSSIHSSNEKPKEGSSHGDKSNQGPNHPFQESEPEVEPEPGPSLPHRSSRVPKPIYKYGSAYGNMAMKLLFRLKKKSNLIRHGKKLSNQKLKL